MTRTTTMWGAAATAALLAAAALASAPAQASETSAGTATRSLAALETARTSIDAPLRAVAGTAWGVDTKTRQVVVSYDSRVKGAQLATVKAAVARLGGAARLEALNGTLTRYISGGQAIYNTGGRCSLGFNVVKNGTYYFLTAGHCTDLGGNWYANSSRTTLLGPTAGSSFPGNDYGLVQYTNTSVAHPGNVSLYNGSFQDITSAANPSVGQTVRRSGSTTGVRSGTVTALNQTVNYGGGDVVSGLIRTTVCAEPGDSGGSLFNGTVAYGLTSGGSGNCRTGGTTFFQPVVEALSAYGVNVY